MWPDLLFLLLGVTSITINEYNFKHIFQFSKYGILISKYP